MKASDTIDRARLILNDPVVSPATDGIRWLNAEMLGWLTDAQRTIVLVRPDANTMNEQVTLMAGTRQSLPTGGLRLLDIVRNVPNSVVEGGRSVRLVDRETLDAFSLNWHKLAPAATIINYAYDNRNPLVYYVYPPAASVGVKLEIIYSKTPTPVTALTDDLSVNDIYADPALNYVLFRCYCKDAQFAQNAQLASAYLQTFMAMLGLKTKKDAAFSPDFHSKATSPDALAVQLESV